jgi:hypothetical protein
MLKQKLTRSDENISLNIPISSENHIYNDNFKLDFSEVKTNENINNENNIFKNIVNYKITLNFAESGFYYPNFLNAGYVEDDVIMKRENFRYSSIVICYFDKMELGNQALLHVSYVPLYLFNNLLIPEFNSDLTKEYNYYYINKIFGSNKSIYARFFFFNAKTGKTFGFVNNKFDKKNDERLYYEMYINSNFNAFYLEENLVLNQIDNLEYQNKLNTLPNTVNILPELNLDKKFTIDGNYLEIN